MAFKVLRVASLFLAALIALLTPAQSWAGFDAPFVVFEGPPSFHYPDIAGDVAIDADGNGVFSRVGNVEYGPRDLLWTRSRSATGTVGPVINASSNRLIWAPDLACDSSGNAHLVWVNFRQGRGAIQARTQLAAGVLGPVQDISTPAYPARFPKVAIDAADRALIVWQTKQGGIQARSRSADGVLGRIETIMPSGPHRARILAVAVNAQGNAIVVFSFRYGSATYVRAAVRSSPTGAFSLTRLITGAYVGNPDVAIDAQGRALVVWATGQNGYAYFRTVSAAGVLGPARIIASGNILYDSPRVAAAPNGRALIAWTISNARILWMRSAHTAGALGPAKLLSRNGGDHVQLHLTPAGEGLVAWRALDRRIRAITISPTGGVGREQLVSPIYSQPERAGRLRLAGNARGQVLALWTVENIEDLDGYRMEAAAGTVLEE